MVVQYALRGPRIFSSGISSLEVYKPILYTVVFEIDVLGGATATPIFPPDAEPPPTVSRLVKVVESSNIA